MGLNGHSIPDSQFVGDGTFELLDLAQYVEGEEWKREGREDA